MMNKLIHSMQSNLFRLEQSEYTQLVARSNSLLLASNPAHHCQYHPASSNMTSLGGIRLNVFVTKMMLFLRSKLCSYEKRCHFPDWGGAKPMITFKKPFR